MVLTINIHIGIAIVMDFNALVIISRHYYNELGVTL